MKGEQMPVVFANDYVYADTATITVNTDFTDGVDDWSSTWDNVRINYSSDPKPAPKNLREALGKPDWEL
jgi:hypothetical protein